MLSLFGLVPASLIGIDLATLLGRGEDMAAACGTAVAPTLNPGSVLGAVMGTLALSGRDKVTLVTSPKIKSFGLWAEQLLAESTGKEGKGLVPIAEEPLASPAAYGRDRLFVYLRLNGDANTVTDRHVKALERAGQPVVRLTLRDRYDLAAEFFRWEFATAVAGRILGIHPFDQPNVQESTENTSLILDEVKARGSLPTVPTGGTLADLLAKAAPGKSLAILAYLRYSSKADQAIKSLRKTLLVRHHLATTAGYGPRYLHSTGQLHKGGPNSGLFLQLVETMTPDVLVPEKPYTFGTLAQAQAIGDFQSLQAHHRPVVQIALGKQGTAAIGSLLRKPEHA
ncbi:MAG: glucose-6-phosphate isomerase, partial [Nitrospiraceae bacterium]